MALGHMDYGPSPEEIERRKEEIQAAWTDAERRIRRVTKDRAFETPVCNLLRDHRAGYSVDR